MKNILHNIPFLKPTKESMLKLKNILAAENSNTKAIFSTYGKYINNSATKEEMEEANDKFRDLVKAIGLGSLLIIPGTVITLPIILISARKLGIELLPKSFYDEFPNLREKNKK
jgi:hypothetical protein